MSSVCCRTVERVFKQEYSYISKAVDLCEEKMLPCPSHMIDVFSDTAVIAFPPHILHKVPQTNWAESPEPEYRDRQDLEIILKETQSWLDFIEIKFWYKFSNM